MKPASEAGAGRVMPGEGIERSEAERPEPEDGGDELQLAPTPASGEADDNIDIAGLMAEDGAEGDAIEAATAKKRRRYEDEKGSFLGKYFRDMAALDVMPPEQEFRAARELEALEIAIWQALLSHAPSVEAVLGLVEALLDNSMSEFRTVKRLAAAAQGVAVGQQVQVYQRADGSLALTSEYNRDEDRDYLLRRLHDMARRLEPLCQSPAEFARLFPKLTAKTDPDAPVLVQLSLFE
jgi:hypothetical protein